MFWMSALFVATVGRYAVCAGFFVTKRCFYPQSAYTPVFKKCGISALSRCFLHNHAFCLHAENFFLYLYAFFCRLTIIHRLLFSDT